MKLFIPTKKTEIAPAKPAQKKNQWLPTYVPMDYSLVGVEPRECTACGHVYVKPCDGDAKCPNFVYLQANPAK